MSGLSAMKHNEAKKIQFEAYRKRCYKIVRRKIKRRVEKEENIKLR
jgi:hypothetical protein